MTVSRHQRIYRGHRHKLPDEALDMAVEDRIRSLRDRHATLDTEIHHETIRAMPDSSKLAELKREKLRIKDTIAQLQR